MPGWLNGGMPMEETHTMGVRTQMGMRVQAPMIAVRPDSAPNLSFPICMWMLLIVLIMLF